MSAAPPDRRRPGAARYANLPWPQRIRRTFFPNALSWAIPPVRLALSGRNSGKIPERTPEMLSEHFLEFPSRVRLGCPKPYNSRHLRLPEHFQNYLPPSTAGGASFFRSGSGEGLPEPVMEFPAVLGVFLISESCYTPARNLLRNELQKHYFM